MKKNRIQVKENKVVPSLDKPMFSIQYKDKQPLQFGKRIISGFKQKSDILMQINTSGVTHLTRDTESYAERLIQKAAELSIDYRYSKVPCEDSGTVLDKLFSLSSKAAYQHEILFLFNDSDWNFDKADGFRTPAPARYFIIKDGIDSGNYLYTFNNMMDKQKLESCRYVIYDWPEIFQMGITSVQAGYSDIMSIIDSINYNRAL